MNIESTEDKCIKNQHGLEQSDEIQNPIYLT